MPTVRASASVVVDEEKPWTRSPAAILGRSASTNAVDMRPLPNPRRIPGRINPAACSTHLFRRREQTAPARAPS